MRELGYIIFIGLLLKCRRILEFPRVKSFEAEIIIMFRAKADHIWSSFPATNFLVLAERGS
jgi:hypothetical protein